LRLLALDNFFFQVFVDGGQLRGPFSHPALELIGNPSLIAQDLRFVQSDHRLIRRDLEQHPIAVENRPAGTLPTIVLFILKAQPEGSDEIFPSRSDSAPEREHWERIAVNHSWRLGHLAVNLRSAALHPDHFHGRAFDRVARA
jgi:hypothetical protein